MLGYIENIAAVSPLGYCWEETWLSLLTGKPGACFGQSPGINFIEGLNNGLEILPSGICGRATHLANDCLDQLLQNIPGENVNFYGGSTHGEADLLLHFHRNFNSGAVRPFLGFETIPDFLTRTHTNLAVRIWLYASCVSGLLALQYATLELPKASGSTTVVMGVDAINDIEVAGFNKIGAITKNRCLPFFENRDGILISEGAAALTLNRNPGKLGIGILGIGSACDAGDTTRPDKNGRGLKSCISQAIKQAGIDAGDLGAIIAHGTGTKANEDVEGRIIAEITGGNLVPVTSIKGSLGHTMGASGLFSILTGAYSLTHGLLLPISDDYNQNNKFGLNLANGQPMIINKSKPLLVLASGFGGNNVAVILKKQ